VEYHDDDDDSNCAEEIEKYGYTVPEYFFVAEYEGVESKESKQLNTNGWGELLITDKNNKPIVNTKCFIILNDEIIETKTNQEGYVRHNFKNIGNYKIII